MTEKLILTGGLIFLILFGVSCDRNRKSEVVADSSPTAAIVGIEPITAEELNRYIKQRLSGAPSGIDVKIIEGYLQELVTTRSLAQEARRQQLDKQPEVRRELDQLLATRLLEEKVVWPVTKRHISDEEISEFYQKHKKEYSRPEQLRLVDIFLAAPKDGDSKIRQQKRSEAETILQKAISAAGKRNGFSRLVRSHSDKHPLYQRGDTGFFDRQGEPIGLDPALVEAAFSIGDKGAVLDRLVETKDGFHIVMLVGRRSHVERSIDDVSAQIRQRIRREELYSKKREFVESIIKDTKVKIHNTELQSLAAELQEVQKARFAARSNIAADKNRDKSTPPMLQERGKE